MKSRWFGINVPFVGGNERFFSRQSGLRIIKNDILQLLLTAPTQRVMRPTFGSDIPNYVFEGQEVNSLTRLRNNILDIMAREEPRVVVEDLILEPHKDDNRVDIKLRAHETADPNASFWVETSLEAPGVAQ